MYKRHIEHLAMVSLKYFFDLDYSMFSHFFIVALVFISLFKLFFNNIVNIFHEGVVSVKEDAFEIKSNFLTLRENWENSTTRERLTNNIQSLKKLVPQKLS